MKEHEVKFTTELQIQLKLQRQLLTSNAGIAVTRIREMLGISQEIHMESNGFDSIQDIYFDTDDLDLYHKGLSLRLRKTAKGYELNYKEPSGDPVSKRDRTGEVRRNEHAVPLTPEQVASGVWDGFSEIRKECFPQLGRQEMRQMVRLANFRSFFELKDGASNWEMVIDQVVFMRPESRKTSQLFFEVEVEAKNDSARDNLARVGAMLFQRGGGLKPSRISKYQRGVKMLSLNRAKWLQVCGAFIDHPIMKVLGWIIGAVGLLAAFG